MFYEYHTMNSIASEAIQIQINDTILHHCIVMSRVYSSQRKIKHKQSKKPFQFCQCVIYKVPLTIL